MTFGAISDLQYFYNPFTNFYTNLHGFCAVIRPCATTIASSMSARTAEKSRYQTDVPMSSARRIHHVLRSMRDSYLDIFLSSLVRCVTNAEGFQSDSELMSGVPFKVIIVLDLRISNSQVDIAHSQSVEWAKIPHIDPFILAQPLFPVTTQIDKVNNGRGVRTRPSLRTLVMFMRIIIVITLPSLVNFFLDLPRQHKDSAVRPPIADQLLLCDRMDIKISIDHPTDHQPPTSHHITIQIAVSPITTTILVDFLAMMALKKMATITGSTMSDP